MNYRSRVTALIDGDLLAYQFTAPRDVAYDWGDGSVSTIVEGDDVAIKIDEFIRELKDVVGATHHKVALSVPSAAGFRRRVFDGYKRNREGHQKPTQLGVMKDYLRRVYRAVVWPLLEADDVLGIWATSPRKVPGEKVVMSYDKDLATVPCTLYNWRTKELREVSREEADRAHLFQTLTGDSTDGYPGCPGIGPVKANRILDDNCSWRAVTEAFEDRGLRREDARIQAILARILRNGDYSLGKGVRLWKPSPRWTVYGWEPCPTQNYSH
jgi:DNA polymerase-1